MGIVKAAAFDPSALAGGPMPSEQAAPPKRRGLFKAAAPEPMHAADEPVTQSAGMKPARFLRNADTAALDIRKVCNTIKRTAAIAAAATAGGIDPQELADTVEAATNRVLEGVGYDTSDDSRMASAIPMVTEAISTMMASSIGAGATLRESAAEAADTLIALSRNRSAVRAIERSWPDDMDSSLAISICASGAMAGVASEAATFNFNKDTNATLKEAATALYGAVQLAADAAAPAGTPRAARMTLTLSLLQTAGKLMATAWRLEADQTIEEVNALPPAQRKARIASMEAASAAQAIAPVLARFKGMLDDTLAAAAVVRDLDARQQLPRAPAPEPREGRRSLFRGPK